jgi:hypothetical protein
MYLIKKLVTELKYNSDNITDRNVGLELCSTQVGYMSTCWNSFVIHLLKLQVTLCLWKLTAVHF